MERLWTPWRMAYVSGTSGEADACFLCAAADADDDAAARVLYRGERALVIMNAFPYNTGHLMVAPVRHVAALSELDAAERTELMELTNRSCEVVTTAMAPHGFNIGMNIGEVAGAGVPGHVHVHVVPRWGGDTNFMPVVGDTKVLPETLDGTYAKLKPGFETRSG